MNIHHNVLLVPMQPTPNGRLHIGHGGGTYLRADVIARALRAQGHKVAVITGSDAYEDWVVAAAQREGRSPEQTYRHYHADIARDLSRLSIALDAWIDPAGEDHRDAYRDLHEKVLARLRVTGAARLECEQVPYAQDTGRPLVGPWIAGACPHCRRPCGGSTCTYCGEYFVPEQLLDARSRLSDSPVEWRVEENWFALADDPQAIADRHRAAGLRPVFLAPLLRALDRHGGRIRLTGQGDWGIHSPGLAAGKVISNGYFLYSVYCGEVYRSLTNAAVNPFSPGSGVTTVGLFGSDNSTPGLLCPDVIAQGSRGTLAPFDATVVNGMLHFEGHKCSTSKRHGIWLSELLEGTSVSSDELRFALSHAPVDHGPAETSVADLTYRINTLRDWQGGMLRPPTSTRSSAPTRRISQPPSWPCPTGPALHSSRTPSGSSVLPCWAGRCFRTWLTASGRSWASPVSPTCSMRRTPRQSHEPLHWYPRPPLSVSARLRCGHTCTFSRPRADRARAATDRSEEKDLYPERTVASPRSTGQ